MRRRSASACWLHAVATLLVAHAATAGASGLDQLHAFLEGTQSAQGAFTQVVVNRDGRTTQTTAGTFAFARPGKFRWTYEKPHQQLIVGDGQKLWIYDPDLKQVTVKRIDQAISSTPAALLAGRDDITRLFTLKDAGAADGLEWVEALPKAQDTGFERVRLGLRGKVLAAMELHDSLGGRTVLHFSDLVANAALPADTFRFTPPAGADVLEDAPPPGKR
jgi:outer membrane lipoprotein carrier protein